jgi:hypothetical protein
MTYGDFGGPGQRKNKANLPDLKGLMVAKDGEADIITFYGF